MQALTDADAAPSPVAPRERVLAAALIAPIVALGGIRFSDGSTLLAIARGSGMADPVFARASAQYVWDSPLKVALLTFALPARIVPIALAFAVLALLPLLGLLARHRRGFDAAAAALLLTPALKISLQNIGLGDGLVILLVILIAASSSELVIAAAFFAIGLWHPQQSFFIGLSYLLGRYGRHGRVALREWRAPLGALAAAALVFAVYKRALGVNYSGRAAYMASQVPTYLARNPAIALVALAPSVVWIVCLGVERTHRAVLFAWLALLTLLAWFTDDVTRVLTLTSLPLALAAATQGAHRALSPRLRWAAGAVMIAFIPPYSWSHFDFCTWHDLVSDVCRWGVLCF